MARVEVRLPADYGRDDTAAAASEEPVAEVAEATETESAEAAKAQDEESKKDDQTLN